MPKITPLVAEINNFLRWFEDNFGEGKWLDPYDDTSGVGGIWKSYLDIPEYKELKEACRGKSQTKNKDVYGILISAIISCGTSIMVHIDDVTEEDYKDLQEVYEKILKTQTKIVMGKLERDVQDTLG